MLDGSGEHLDGQLHLVGQSGGGRQRLVRHGSTEREARAVASTLACTVLPADEALAVETGVMRRITDRAGLSLADRFCLALAKRLAAPAATADRHWALIAEAVGVEVKLIS